MGEAQLSRIVAVQPKAKRPEPGPADDVVGAAGKGARRGRWIPVRAIYCPAGVGACRREPPGTCAPIGARGATSPAG